MNIVFIYGKIVSDIDFNFIIDGKHVSVAIFELKLINKSIVKVKAYDEMADECYRKLENEDRLVILGLLNSYGEVEIKEIEL